MPLQSAEVSMESAQEGGQMWHHITLTSYLDGVSHDSGVQGDLHDRNRPRRRERPLRAALRTADITLAQEWVAILKYACGFQRERETHRLLDIIAAGDSQRAGALAEDLARQAATAPRDRTRSSVAQGKTRERRPSDETSSDPAGMSGIREELPLSARQTSGCGGSVASADAAGKTRTTPNPSTDDGAASVASESGDEDDLTTLSAASAAAGKRSKFAAQALAFEQQNRELLQRVEELLQEALRVHMATPAPPIPSRPQRTLICLCRRRACC